MSKKVIFFFMGVLFFSSYHLVHADVVINEIMYAPTNGSNYEWVEIFNSGSSAVDLQGWRFFHGESTSGPLTLRNGSTTVLGPSEYAIIAKSPSVVTDYSWLNFSGMILSASTLSLPDSGSNTYIAIASDTNKTISNSVVYDPSLGGSKDTGNSLSKISNTWTGATSTPGLQNQASSGGTGDGDNTDTTDDDSSDDSGSSSSVGGGTSASDASLKETSTQKIKIKIIAKTPAFINIPFTLQAQTTGGSSSMFYGRYFWNFGDGDFKEVRDTSPFSHNYMYQGDYPLSVEYYANDYSTIPDAVGKMTVKVVSMNVSISKVGDASDFFIELSNNTDYEVDISKWILSSALQKNFILPKNTVILAKKKMRLSSLITHFTLPDAKGLKLSTGEGQLVFDYGASLVPAQASAPASSQTPAAVLVTYEPSPVGENELVEKKEETEKIKNDLPENPTDQSIKGDTTPKDLSATAFASDVATDEEKSNHSYIPTISFVVFIGAAAGAVYVIRKNKTVSAVGDDFKILDE